MSAQFERSLQWVVHIVLVASNRTLAHEPLKICIPKVKWEILHWSPRLVKMNVTVTSLLHNLFLCGSWAGTYGPHIEVALIQLIKQTNILCGDVKIFVFDYRHIEFLDMSDWNINRTDAPSALETPGNLFFFFKHLCRVSFQSFSHKEKHNTLMTGTDSIHHFERGIILPYANEYP